MRRTLTLTLALVTLGACGYTDGGGGSKTLEVKAVLEYHAGQNAIDADVVVRKNGVAVEGAAVVLIDGDDDASFALELQSNGNHQSYRANVEGYHRKMALKVESGSDDLHGQLEGPGSFIISNPDNEQHIKRSSNDSILNVRWVTQDGIAADEVTIRYADGGFETTIQEDRGNYDVPASKLDTSEDDVQVARRNRVGLTGGVLSSTLELSYVVSNHVIIQD
jgi:hypothetical protein